MQVLAEKLGAPDAKASRTFAALRTAAAAEEPEGVCEPACGWYNERLEQLALLEFDRDRKSMSVLCRTHPATRTSGVYSLGSAGIGGQ